MLTDLEELLILKVADLDFPRFPVLSLDGLDDSAEEAPRAVGNSARPGGCLVPRAAAQEGASARAASFKLQRLISSGGNRHRIPRFPFSEGAVEGADCRGKRLLSQAKPASS